MDWVTGEQKVTRAQDDADACGWADDVLVCVEIRGGRMRCWRQRPCGAAAGTAGTWPGRRPAGRPSPAAMPNWRPVCARRGPDWRPAQACCSMNLCWVKLYQLPESSRMIASTP
jgi:hypothetical protein